LTVLHRGRKIASLLEVRMRFAVGLIIVVSTLPGLPSPARSENDGVWQEMAPPPVRTMHAGALDAARNRVVLMGGVYNEVGALTNSVHTLDLATGWWNDYWILGGPAPRRDHSLVHDAEGDRLVLFGGWDGHVFLSDLWELRLSDMTWSQLSPSGPGPGARAEHMAVYDTERGRMLVIMGYDGAASTAEVWALDLRGPPAWALLTPAGTPPAARHSHAAVYDEAADRALVIAGASRAVRGGGRLRPRDGAALHFRWLPPNQHEWARLAQRHLDP
jgi:hypothetical protein